MTNNHDCKTFLNLEDAWHITIDAIKKGLVNEEYVDKMTKLVINMQNKPALYPSCECERAALIEHIEMCEVYLAGKGVYNKKPTT